MKTKLARLVILAAAALAAAPAPAEVVAAWDFSQYFAEGALSVDGEGLVDTLDANYSDFDQTYGAGAGAAAFGRMYLDGSFGSTSTPLDFDNDPFVPSGAAGGSLLSNLDAPLNSIPTIDAPFDSCAVLQAEGQLFCNPLAMIALEMASVVFSADLSAVPATGSSWMLTFAGRTFSGTSQVTIDASTGGGFAQAAVLDLTTTDTAYVVNLGGPSEVAYVRFHFDPSAPDLPFLDNVAIATPEPAAALAAGSALATLASLRRRRA